MRLNWDDMRFFLVLCRTQSFVGAGAELRVTHSTVSRRLSSLEESLQTKLFNRTEKGCRLTAMGEKLLPYAEQLESTVFSLEAGVSGKNSQLSGTVRICAPDGYGHCFLASRLGIIQQNHPSLEIELIALPRYYSLLRREIDILITVTKPAIGNLIVRKLADYRWGMFATKSYLQGTPPVRSLDDLRLHRTIGYIPDLLYDQDLDLSNEFNLGVSPQFRSSTIFGQKYAILSDCGIGILPYFMVHGEKDLVQVLPALKATRTFWLQVNPDSRKIARVRVTVDLIVQEMEAEKVMFLDPPINDVGQVKWTPKSE